MIKNERQYRITKTAAERFERALADLSVRGVEPDVDPLIQRAECEGIRSQLLDLRSQLREYESLVAGRVELIELSSVEELPDALVRARIAAGLSQKDLADRLGLKEQQVQRYEATNYRSCSLERLLEVARALELQIRKELFLPSSATPKLLTDRLEQLGLSRDFVRDRLTLRVAGRTGAGKSVFGALRAISHVFGWSAAALLGSDRPWLEAGVLGAARYKVSAAADRKKVSVYSIYAHYLALQVLQATEGLPQTRLSVDPAEWRDLILQRQGDLSFASVLQQAWESGIAVLPLRDAGAFHGAFWRVDGRNVVVLKQRTPSLSRWTFDLLHEIWHAAQEPDAPSRTILEAGDMSIGNLEDEEEQDASAFAGDVMLGGIAEELVDDCVSRAGGKVERLKSVVPAVAAAAHVEADALANYLAFRLSLQNIDWWGAAANLQRTGEDPTLIAREALRPHLNLRILSELDQELLRLALESPMETRK